MNFGRSTADCVGERGRGTDKGRDTEENIYREIEIGGQSRQFTVNRYRYMQTKQQTDKET